MRYAGIEVELRQAIEPWHVLGEEAAGGGTVRYVDSSVERLQVEVAGMTDHALYRHLQRPPRPAHPTGTLGEYVAGVRYRAWQPPCCLHPTIPVACAAGVRLVLSDPPGPLARSLAAPTMLLITAA